jgi:DNA processing protein
VLDLLAEVSGHAYAPPDPAAIDPWLPEPLADLLRAVGEGRGTLAELATDDRDPRAILAGLGELEARGLVRRGFGGRYERALT